MNYCRLHYAFFTKRELPLPRRPHCVGQWGFGFPTEHLIGTRRVSPHLHDISLAAPDDAVWHLDARSLLECVDKFDDRDSTAGAEIEDFDRSLVGPINQTTDSLDMGFGEVDDINEVADAAAVNTDSSLRIPMAVCVR